jgi:hypothetical protein
MNKLSSRILLTGIGVLVASCGTASTPVMLYANAASSLVTLDEGFDLETEYDGMINGGQLHIQQSQFMDAPRFEVFQNEWVEVRELFDTIRQTQRLQNQQRILIKLEASVLNALATVIEENNLSLSETSTSLLLAAQATLDVTKNTIIELREDIKVLLVELRTLMRSVNRPMMWSETLVTDVTVVLTSLLPLTEALALSIESVLPSLISIRQIFIDTIPPSLSPLTEEVLLALSLFETQLVDLNVLQEEIQSVQKDTRLLIKDIHSLVKTMRAEGIVLTSDEKADIAIKRLAVADAVDSLRTIATEGKETILALKGMISLENLTFLNESMSALLTTGEARLALYITILSLNEEIKTTLNG